MAKMAIYNIMYYVPTHVCIYCLYICRGESKTKVRGRWGRVQNGGDANLGHESLERGVRIFEVSGWHKLVTVSNDIS